MKRIHWSILSLSLLLVFSWGCRNKIATSPDPEALRRRSNTPTSTRTATSTPTSLLPSHTSTSTPTSVPPTATWTVSPSLASLTPVPPTDTPTSVPPTATATDTDTAVPAVDTPTPLPPTDTPTSTSTPLPPTATFTSVPVSCPPCPIVLDNFNRPTQGMVGIGSPIPVSWSELNDMTGTWPDLVDSSNQLVSISQNKLRIKVPITFTGTTPFGVSTNIAPGGGAFIVPEAIQAPFWFPYYGLGSNSNPNQPSIKVTYSGSMGTVTLTYVWDESGLGEVITGSQYVLHQSMLELQHLAGAGDYNFCRDLRADFEKITPWSRSAVTGVSIQFLMTPGSGATSTTTWDINEVRFSDPGFSPVPTHTPSPTPGPLCGPSERMGYDSVGAGVVGLLPSAFAYACKAVLTAAGPVTVKRVVGYVNASGLGPFVKVGIYSHLTTTGGPNLLLAQSASIRASGPGWQAFDIPDVVLAPGTYWLAVLAPGGTFKGDTVAAGNQVLFTPAFGVPTPTSLPGSLYTFPITVNTFGGTQLASLYAEYCP